MPLVMPAAAALYGNSCPLTDSPCNTTHLRLCSPGTNKSLCPPPPPAIEFCAPLFVKFHQVGGTTAESLLNRFRNGLPAPLQRHCPTVRKAHRFGHTMGLQALDWFVHVGAVPRALYAVTILRHPVDKFLSTFYKLKFHTSVDGDKYFREDELTGAWLGDRSERYMQNSTAVEGAIRATLDQRVLDSFYSVDPSVQAGQNGRTRIPSDLLSRTFEYSRYFGDAHTARRLLPQFALVGITEDFPRFYLRLCVLIGAPLNACRRDLQRESNWSSSQRVNTARPRVHSEDLLALIESKTRSAAEIYEEAKKVACRPSELDLALSLPIDSKDKQRLECELQIHSS